MMCCVRSSFMNVYIHFTHYILYLNKHAHKNGHNLNLVFVQLSDDIVNIININLDSKHTGNTMENYVASGQTPKPLALLHACMFPYIQDTQFNYLADNCVHFPDNGMYIVYNCANVNKFCLPDLKCLLMIS